MVWRRPEPDERPATLAGWSGQVVIGSNRFG